MKGSPCLNRSLNLVYFSVFFWWSFWMGCSWKDINLKTVSWIKKKKQNKTKGWYCHTSYNISVWKVNVWKSSNQLKMRSYNRKYGFPSVLCDAANTTVSMWDSTHNLIAKSTLINTDIMNIAHTHWNKRVKIDKIHSLAEGNWLGYSFFICF